MACHNSYMDSEKDFYQKLKNRDPDIITKMVRCVISAHKRKKDKIDIFDLYFKDSSSLTFSMQKEEYIKFLGNCLDDMIKIEEYELCAEIKKIISKPTRKPRVKKQKQINDGTTTDETKL